MEYKELNATRYGYSKALIELCKEGDDIVVFDADLAKSTTTVQFKAEYPDRFVDVGIAEMNMVGLAAGTSLTGKIPFATTYSAFLAGRAFDQIRTTVCYSNLNVKFGGMHTGLTVGQDGPTHQMLEDIALMRVLPNMTLLNPCDTNEAYLATKAATKINGPVYIRFVREKTPVFTSTDDEFIVGKAKTVIDGNDFTIISTGPMVWLAIEAAEALAKENISVRVINIHTIKPLDEEAILKAVNETKGILVVDEHQIYGGLGSAVAEVVAKAGNNIKFDIKGVEDTFNLSAPAADLMKEAGFTTEAVIEKVKGMLS